MDFYRSRRLLGGVFGKRSAKRPSNDDSELVTNLKLSGDDSSSDASSTDHYSDDAAIRRLTEQRDGVAEELRCTRQDLQEQKQLTKELNQRLIMKSINTDCQLSEMEEKFGQTKSELRDLTQQNAEMSDKLMVVKLENQNLMKRTAALARRDQIQKATIMASNNEILKLMNTVEEFEDKFLSLQDEIAFHKETYQATDKRPIVIDLSNAEMPPEAEMPQRQISQDNEDEDSSVNSSEADKPFDVQKSNSKKRANDEYSKKQRELETMQAEFKAKLAEFEATQAEHKLKQQEWQTEREELFNCIKKLKSNNKEIKKKFVQTLKKHQWKWHKEREKLLKKVGDLEVWLDEKETEMIVTKSVLADAFARGMESANNAKGDIKKSDTFTTQDESLSTCSSSDSRTIARSLTETTDNTTECKIKKAETMNIFDDQKIGDDKTVDIFKLINNDKEEEDASISETSNHFDATPLKSNGPSRRDDLEVPKNYIATPPIRRSVSQ